MAPQLPDSSVPQVSQIDPVTFGKIIGAVDSLREEVRRVTETVNATHREVQESLHRLETALERKPSQEEVKIIIHQELRNIGIDAEDKPQILADIAFVRSERARRASVSSIWLNIVKGVSLAAVLAIFLYVAAAVWHQAVTDATTERTKQEQVK